MRKTRKSSAGDVKSTWLLSKQRINRWVIQRTHIYSVHILDTGVFIELWTSMLFFLLLGTHPSPTLRQTHTFAFSLLFVLVLDFSKSMILGLRRRCLRSDFSWISEARVNLSQLLCRNRKSRHRTWHVTIGDIHAPQPNGANLPQVLIRLLESVSGA